MIARVWDKANEAALGRVVVAAGDQEIADAVRKAGGESVLTEPGLRSGTDRVFAALCEIDPGQQFRFVLNLQGDLPHFDPAILKDCLEALIRTGSDMGTLVNRFSAEDNVADTAKVKAVVAWEEERLGRALYFSRSAVPWGEGPFYHHIGIYGFKRESLSRFVGLGESGLERREKLEQLRALEAGMKIGVKEVDSSPFGIDTPGDLEKIRHLLAP